MKRNIVWLALALFLPLSGHAVPNPQDAWQPGVNEGNQRGRADGFQAGDQAGYREAFDREVRRFEDLARLDGERQGGVSGIQLGQQEGSRNGARDGEIEGVREGISDGERRADRDALASVQVQATRDGQSRAESSDCLAVGKQQGTAAGQQAAEERAATFDLQRGHDEYRAERYSQPSKGVETRRQGRIQPPLGSQPFWLWADRLVLCLLSCVTAPHCRPDHRFCKPQAGPADYQAAFKRIYEEGFNSVYARSWQIGYEEAYRAGHHRACREAESRGYQGVFQIAFDAAHRLGYDRAYKSIYTESRQQTYTAFFRANSEKVYHDALPHFQKKHFEEVSQKAYQSEYERLRKMAFDQAKAATYGLNYPALARKKHILGRVEEKTGFETRPVRLLAWTAEPSDVKDLYITTVSLRNFGAKPVAGNKIRLRVTTPGQAEWLVNDTLVLDKVSALGVVHVTGAIRFNWSQTGAPGATLEATYDTGQGWQSIGTCELALKN